MKSFFKGSDHTNMKETQTSICATGVAIVTAKCERKVFQTNQVTRMKLVVVQLGNEAMIRPCFKVMLLGTKN